MATLLDRANALIGVSVKTQFIAAALVSDFSAVPSTIDQEGTWQGNPRSLLVSWDFKSVKVDSLGNVVITFQTVSKNGNVNPPTDYAVIAADDNNTVLGLLPYGAASGYLSYFLISNQSLNPANTPVKFPITDLASSGFVANQFGPCYAKGTRILTARGEVAIEDLTTGDLLRVTNEDGVTLRPVVWIGRQRVNLRASQDPALVRPVRIRAGAFAAGMPTRDLLVSPDHAIYTDGVLVPAHLLINGGSIVQDEAMETVEYFHVELDRHAAILAEGLAAESYLPGLNRSGMSAHNVAALNPAFPDPDADAYATAFATLALGADQVRPIWARLAARSEAMAMAVPVTEASTDAAPHVMIGGVAVQPVQDGKTHRFAIPAGTAQVRLMSRSARPADTRPWLDDRRSLGVLVEAIALVGTQRHAIALDGAALTDGWWLVERDGAVARRWTDGAATIVLPALAEDAVLELTLTGEMHYPLEISRAA